MNQSIMWLTSCCGTLAVFLGSCALSVVAPCEPDPDALTLELAAFPNRISVNDSTAVAQVWATLRVGDKPVEDSIQVVFVATVGTIEPVGFTRDGLAIVLLRSPADGRPRRGEVIAQALTVRDTLVIDFVLIDEEHADSPPDRP